MNSKHHEPPLARNTYITMGLAKNLATEGEVNSTAEKALL
jgi:hypothetical protein